MLFLMMVIICMAYAALSAWFEYEDMEWLILAVRDRERQLAKERHREAMEQCRPSRTWFLRGVD